MTLAFRHLLSILCITILLGTSLGAHAQKPGPVSLPEARAIVMELPEVKTWQTERQSRVDTQKAMGEKGAPPVAGVLTGRREVGKAAYWAVTLYDNPQLDPKKWAVFLVRATDGRIFVEGNDGKPVALDQWRKTVTKPAS